MTPSGQSDTVVRAIVLRGDVGPGSLAHVEVDYCSNTNHGLEREVHVVLYEGRDEQTVVYLSPSAARQLADELRQAADDADA